MDTPLEQVQRWEASGGHWRLLARDGERLVVGLLTCDGGEVAGLVEAADADLTAYVEARGGRDG
ncbi:hypothetical protein [Nocardioides perillae]|uniref:Uncharacterized protein n=1 Tax=Nocardioides perillae TaxID=1119534 RepID=A0A7Y9RTM2_9ACTN|nr:hypothetical protein [Nocardioides perillae]NYG54332.1 hypothetical protein [Nocardioides perillae]